ncbi:DUF3362 domain-containing protein, partial [Clostridium perfringens]|uniref:DUF3362 domain-containing protein n=1 Tax=Clostridium perfringens TaxID=1502 RepID=UPI0038FCFFD7
MGSAAEFIVPFMGGAYILMALIIIAVNISDLPGIIVLIFKSAFGAEATFGGIIGSTIAWGVKRSVYSTEAGQGTGPQASSAAEVSHPAKQGFVQAFSVYVDTLFVRSGIRYDYVMADKDNIFMRELIKHHVSGQLKVAPEHVAEEVLYYMQKPAGETYDRFRQKFFAMNEQMGLKQYLIPYLMSSHPGSTLNSAIELAEYLRDIKYQPEQVQDFYPTPGTLSTTMFYTGLD